MNANILIYTLFLSFLVTQVSYAQRTFATDPEREIIVQFTDEVLTHKNEGVSGRFSDYTFTSNLIKHNLDSVGIETISTLFPEFKKEDRLVETRNGKQVTLSDWSNTMILHLPANRSREKFIELLNQLPEVVYAEANVQGSSEVIYDFRDEYDSGSEAEAFMPVTPNDPNFNRQWALKNTGTSIQGSGTPDADIDADLAWDITTGSSSIKIAIIDQGVQNSHPEFNGKITGYPTFYSNHGTMVAGIAAAYGNNSAGITGVAYSASIIDEWTGYQSASDLASAVTNASQQGAHVLNASWGIDDYSVTLRKAIRDAYLLNQVFITSAGNSEGHKYPQHIRDGMITVSGTTNNDGKFSNSSTGSWVDVAAPAGEFSEQNDRIYSTLPGGNYGYSGAGTSYAAPHVSGIAALLLSENPNLYNDDIENLIEISAEDINNNGFDNTFGHGRVNAYEALKLLQSPYVLNYGSTTGGSFYSQSGGFPMRTYDVSGLSSGLQYYVKRVEVRKNISFSYLDEPNVWCRGVESVGWTKEEDHGGAKRNYGQGFCEVVPGTLTNTSAT
ncbi:MAG: S8 family serine peptidase, partial [Gracilimonas sp.]